MRSTPEWKAEVPRAALGLLLLVAFQLLGVWLHRLGAPLPPNVLGLVLLLAALETGLVRLAWIARAADFLVGHMMLFFVPLLAALPTMSDRLRADGLALLTSLVTSLVAVLVSTGALAQLLSHPEDET